MNGASNLMTMVSPTNFKQNLISWNSFETKDLLSSLLLIKRYQNSCKAAEITEIQDTLVGSISNGPEKMNRGPVDYNSYIIIIVMTAFF